MAQVGYARVSTGDQDTALQLDALDKTGVRVVFQESTSSVGPRPQLQRALKSLCPGDVLVVWKVDRLARSLADLLQILTRLKAVGAALKSLTEPIDTSTPIGEFTIQILGAVAQLERSLIRERSIAGQVAAIRKGRWPGRPRKLTPDQELELFDRWAQGESKASLARYFGVSFDVVKLVILRMVDPCHPRVYGNRKVLGPLLQKETAL